MHLAEQQPNPDSWHGAALTVTILGNWPYYRAKVLKYLRQIAVITPYAQFQLRFEPEDARGVLVVNYLRRTDAMPVPPKVQLSPALLVLWHSVLQFIWSCVAVSQIQWSPPTTLSPSSVYSPVYNRGGFLVCIQCASAGG